MDQKLPEAGGVLLQLLGQQEPMGWDYLLEVAQVKYQPKTPILTMISLGLHLLSHLYLVEPEL